MNFLEISDKVKQAPCRDVLMYFLYFSTCQLKREEILQNSISIWNNTILDWQNKKGSRNQQNQLIFALEKYKMYIK